MIELSPFQSYPFSAEIPVGPFRSCVVSTEVIDQPANRFAPSRGELHRCRIRRARKGGPGKSSYRRPDSASDCCVQIKLPRCERSGRTSGPSRRVNGRPKAGLAIRCLLVRVHGGGGSHLVLEAPPSRPVSSGGGYCPVLRSRRMKRSRASVEFGFSSKSVLQIKLPPSPRHNTQSLMRRCPGRP